MTDQEFLQRLRALLAEAGASIEWDCDDSSDMYGITGERMVIRRSDRPILTLPHESSVHWRDSDLTLRGRGEAGSD